MGTLRRALIVGIENYQILHRLNYATNDAVAMTEALSQYQCQFECTTLINENATVSKIRSGFRNLFHDADENATILFFYAGHGVNYEGGTFLITLDSEEDFEAGIDLHRLTEIVKTYRKPTQTCIFLLDCCHSGSLGIENISISVDALQNTILLSSAGITLIAAAEADGKAIESDKYTHGILTYFLFNGLLGEAANEHGDVTVSSLSDYVSKCITEFHPNQKVVYKTTTIGQSPILGRNFSPQQQIEVSKLTESQLMDIDSKIQDQLQLIKHHQDFIHEDIWSTQLHKDSSKLLSELINWRHQLEHKHPDLKNSQRFRHYDKDILHIQTELASMNIGMVLPDGTIEREIGTGGFGTVYEVHTNYGTLEAYKVYHSTQLHDKGKLKAFRRGYTAMQKLDHSNIVKVVRYTEAPIGFYMQYINGSNFRDWWTEDSTKILNLLHVIAQTIEYAHVNGVIHRDIKPENIIVVDDPNNEFQPIPYLTDFDLAWYSMATTYSTMDSKAAVLGHYLYAAPEQYETPNADITKKATADVYGFGQLCYFAVCGTDPARDGDMSKAALQARIEDWVIGEAALRFVSMYTKCIERIPSRRFQTMSEVSAEILNIRNLMIDPDKSKTITEDEFLRELTFSLFGFEKTPDTIFESRSKRTQINIQKRSATLIAIKFDVLVNFGPATVTGTFEQQRKELHKRIDNTLIELKREGINAGRFNERIDNVYATRIEAIGNYLSLAGVSNIRKLIEATINCLES